MTKPIHKHAKRELALCSPQVGQMIIVLSMLRGRQICKPHLLQACQLILKMAPQTQGHPSEFWNIKRVRTLEDCIVVAVWEVSSLRNKRR